MPADPVRPAPRQRRAGELQTVFDILLDKAMALCGADFGMMNTFNGELSHVAANRSVPTA